MDCNYCHNPDKTKQHLVDYSFRCPKIRSDDYEALLERGWINCADYMFKYNFNACCCKLYVPRLDINNFTLSSSQKKHMKRFNQVINGTRPLTLRPCDEPKSD